MTKDDIIRMAQEAGALVSPGISSADVTFSPATIERFANLVATAEREACAVVCDGAYYQNIGPAFGEVRHGIATCSTAIRARSQS